MTTPNIEELRELAENAYNESLRTTREFRDFTEAANPAKIIELLDALQSQAERIKSQDSEIERLTVERDVNKRMRDQHFAELEDVRSQVATLNVGFNNVQTDRDQIAAHRDHIAKANDTLRAQLAALQVDDELPEFPGPVAARWQSVPGSHNYAGAGGCAPGSFGEDSEDLYNTSQVQSYARQAQAMARSKMVPLEKDAARYRWLREADPDEGPSVMESRMNDWGRWFNSHLWQSELDTAIDDAMGITGETK